MGPRVQQDLGLKVRGESAKVRRNRNGELREAKVR